VGSKWPPWPKLRTSQNHHLGSLFPTIFAITYKKIAKSICYFSRYLRLSKRVEKRVAPKCNVQTHLQNYHSSVTNRDRAYLRVWVERAYPNCEQKYHQKLQNVYRKKVRGFKVKIGAHNVTYQQKTLIYDRYFRADLKKSLLWMVLKYFLNKL